MNALPKSWVYRKQKKPYYSLSELGDVVDGLDVMQEFRAGVVVQVKPKTLDHPAMALVQCKSRSWWLPAMDVYPIRTEKQ